MRANSLKHRKELTNYSKIQKRLELAEKLKKESALVKEESLTILKQFEIIECRD